MAELQQKSKGDSFLSVTATQQCGVVQNRLIKQLTTGFASNVVVSVTRKSVQQPDDVVVRQTHWHGCKTIYQQPCIT